ncbi:MAG: acylneuraminate cytidylyltransferase family protein [Desulfobacterales bacterium]|nr:acylneuraminate cytidylyltransferase family protein [Desulfobacterales bacterium]
MTILTTILARGGSKGIPNKNIRMIAGKPLICHTIDQVKTWNKFDSFIVSTDSIQIADVAKEHGAPVPFIRPPHLATDTSGKLDSLRHALIESEKYFNNRFDIIFDLDATSPIRSIDDMDNIVALFTDKNPDCVFSVVKSNKNPYFNMVEKRIDGTVDICKKLEHDILRRQDTPVVFDMNASMYVYSRDFLVNPKNTLPYSGVAYAYEMDALCAYDIDNEIDLEIVELIMKKLQY